MKPARAMPGGWTDPATLDRGEEGRARCRWCDLEVPPRRRSFCSEFCVHEWKLRSDPGYLREQVLARDRGMCAVCGVDCLRAHAELRRSRGIRRQTLLAHWNVRWGQRKSLWDADHIVPVAEGGGECDLGNMRTLCLRCHRAATAALRLRLRAGFEIQSVD